MRRILLDPGNLMLATIIVINCVRIKKLRRELMFLEQLDSYREAAWMN
jgi:hypothetical protein